MDEKRARFEAQVLPHLDAAYRFARWLSRASSEAGRYRAGRHRKGLPWVRHAARIGCEGLADGHRQELPLDGAQNSSSGAPSCRCRRRTMHETAMP